MLEYSTHGLFLNAVGHLILALWKEFEDNLIVVLNGAPYFQASAVTDLAARDDLTFVTLPAYSLGLNPVEECWRQFQSDFGIGSLAHFPNSQPD